MNGDNIFTSRRGSGDTNLHVIPQNTRGALDVNPLSSRNYDTVLIPSKWSVLSRSGSPWAIGVLSPSDPNY